MINAIFVCEKKRQFLVYLFSISNARKRLINSIFVCEKKRQFLIYLFSISNARKRPMNTIFVSEKNNKIFLFYYFCFIKNLTTDKPKIAFFSQTKMTFITLFLAIEIVKQINPKLAFF